MPEGGELRGVVGSATDSSPANESEVSANRPRRHDGASGTWARVDPGLLSWVTLAVGLLLAAGALMYLTRGTTFWADDWLWVVDRRGGGLGTFLDTYNGHLSLVPVTIYKLLFATVGLRHYAAYRLVITACHLGCVTLIYVYAKRRVGELLALLAAALVLVFGPGWTEFLWPFQTGWVIAAGAGIGALLLLDRHDRRGDIAACVLIGVSLASTSAGVAFALGMVVEIAGARRRWRDAWIVATPLALYGLWTATYQHAALGGNVYSVTSFVAQSAAASLSGLLGLGGVTPTDNMGTLVVLGAPLALAAIGLIVWQARRRGGLTIRAWALITMLLAFWCLTALGRAAAIGGPTSARYIYVDAVLTVLIGVELASGVRPSSGWGAVIAAVAAAGVVSNIQPLRSGAGFLRYVAQVAKADLGALQISRELITPSYVAQALPDYPLVAVRAVDLFSAERALGSVADSPAQLAVAPEPARAAADQEMVLARGLRLQPAPRATAPSGPPPAVDASVAGTAVVTGNCVLFSAQAVGSTGTNRLDLTLRSSTVELLSSDAVATVGVRRFAGAFAPVGTLPASAAATLRIAPDTSSVPWHVEIVAAGRVRACGA